MLAWAVRLRYLFRRCTLLLKPRATRKKLEAEWLEKLSPVGANPLTWTTSYTTWCGPDDSDFNMHMSNSSYPKVCNSRITLFFLLNASQNLDMARFNGSLGLNPTLYRCGGWVALGGTHFKYLREIPMLSLYEMRTSIAAWDQKWVRCTCAESVSITHYSLARSTSLRVLLPSRKEGRSQVTSQDLPQMLYLHLPLPTLLLATCTLLPTLSSSKTPLPQTRL